MVLFRIENAWVIKVIIKIMLNDRNDYEIWIWKHFYILKLFVSILTKFRIKFIRIDIRSNIYRKMPTLKKTFICSVVNNAKQEFRHPSVKFLKRKKTSFKFQDTISKIYFIIIFYLVTKLPLFNCNSAENSRN